MCGLCMGCGGFQYLHDLQRVVGEISQLYEVKLFGQNLIVIPDPGIAQEILAKKAKIVSDRPAPPLVKGSRDCGKYLPFLGNNDTFESIHV